MQIADPVGSTLMRATMAATGRAADAEIAKEPGGIVW